MAFENAKWIWIDENSADLYAEFYACFKTETAALTVNISSDSDYTLFINGRYASSGQYGDFEHYKSYDTVDISPYLVPGENSIAILAWHFGTDLQRHYKQTAGVIFEVNGKCGTVCASGEGTLARKSLSYKSGGRKLITPQLGFNFHYDARLEDSWQTGGGEGFLPAVCVEKSCRFIPRPIEKHLLLPKREARFIKSTGKNKYLFDLGEETVGLLSLSLEAKEGTCVTVAWGEHIIDGSVRRIVGGRDFSVEYITKKGKCEFTNYMLRLAGRYIELSADKAISPLAVSLIPTVYPIERRDASYLSGKDKLIYDICVNTLELCMMEHYVDCPWREQCLYAFDSRNQMLTGYYALRGGNFRYARANLKLFGMDRHQDNILSICSPCSRDFTIPSFSLHFIVALSEYLRYSRDTSLPRELDGKVCEILDAFLARRGEDGLIKRFSGENHWNFYDWSDYSDGYPIRGQSDEPDAVINLLAIRALSAYEYICKTVDIPFRYGGIMEELRAGVRQHFLDTDIGLFRMKKGSCEYTELVNSLAILTDTASRREACAIAEKMRRGELTELSLSMRTVRYDAYIKVNKSAYRDTILAEIRRDWGKMLDEGSTTVWETAVGASDFQDAGSLCHGWSALPVYYYNVLMK